MGLFGDLPAPKRPADEAVNADQPSKTPRLEAPGDLPEPSAADLQDLEDEDGVPAEQEEHEAAAAAAVTAGQADEGVPPPPPPPREQHPGVAPASGDDQVSAALRKIASHISHPKKFVKASQLLRELLAQGAVTARHGPLLFSALKAAMADPGQAAEPLLAREYSKLFTAASKVAEVFSAKEKNQLDVYGTWAVLRNQLATDDSFQFNKVVARLKEMVAELPAATEQDDHAEAQLAAAAGAADPVLAAYDERQQQQEAGPAAEQGAAEAGQAGGGSAAAGSAGGGGEGQGEAAGEAAGGAEDDPFGLDALMEQQEQGGSGTSKQPAAAEREADPFGLDALIEQQEAEAAARREAERKRRQEERRRREEEERRRKEAAARQPKSVTWSAAELVNQRRAALLDCLDTAKACYRHMWARTSVDLLIEHCHKHKDRFLASQQQRIDDLMAFVRDQRRVRKLGPSAKELNRDTTSFERARAEWSRAEVSHRGKVGAGGDRGAEAWLG